MSNSNALAFDDYGYEEADQYMGYANDMANNNYYKSQGSDFVKKLKCNNINNNLNGDNNTINSGSPLGAGAETIQDDASTNGYNGERNGNGNFDLDCINNNNNEGGGQGQVGPPGPPGITQLNEGTNVYLVTNQTINTDPDDVSIVARAQCDAGDFVLNGGYQVTGSDNILTETLFDQPITSPSGGGWEVVQYVANAGLNSVVLTVTAYCFDNPPLRPLMAAADVSTFQQPEDSPIVSQGIGDSPELSALEKQTAEDSPALTAMEKITKLKTQWMELTP